MNFLGLPRSGKTTFLKRLMGLLLNIKEQEDKLCDREQNREEPSTGIAERPNPIFVTKMGIVDDGNWNIAAEKDQQAKIIAQIIHLSKVSFCSKWCSCIKCLTIQVTS